MNSPQILELVKQLLLDMSKKIGFESFQDFKLNLVLDNGEEDDILEEEKDVTISKDDTPLKKF